MCHSVHRREGVMCGCRGACMVAGGMHGCGGWGACMVAGGHAWQWRGVCGCGGHAWLQGGMRGIRQDTVNERVVPILLECILVLKSFYSMQRWGQCFQSVFFVVLVMNNIISHILDLTRNKVNGTSKSRKR